MVDALPPRLSVASILNFFSPMVTTVYSRWGAPLFVQLPLQVQPLVLVRGPTPGPEQTRQLPRGCGGGTGPATPFSGHTGGRPYPVAGAPSLLQWQPPSSAITTRVRSPHPAKLIFCNTPFCSFNGGAKKGLAQHPRNNEDSPFYPSSMPSSVM
jgi:hypothetical protein